jgi:hypothetical protein
LNEIGDISCITINEEGTRIYIGFSNGKINQYKITFRQKKEKNKEAEYITSILPTQLTENSFEYKNIFLRNNNSIVGENIHIKLNLNMGIFLKKIKKNKFLYNNPHLAKKITILSLNECHNVLVALDETNTIYIISLNNDCKIMHISHFLSNTYHKIKGIIPLQWNGDFLMYSSYNVYLFSINAVPLCQLNLFDKEFEDFYSITCVTAAFLYDIVLFTAHKNGNIMIWKIKNKNINEKFEERISYVYNKKKSKFFLPEYSFKYDSKYNKHNEKKINEYELQRKFEIISCININEEAKTYATFMKMSEELNYLIIFDNKKQMFVLSNEEFRKSSTLRKKLSKEICMNCFKNLYDEGIRPSLLDSTQEEDDLFSEKSSSDNSEKKSSEKGLICEECRQKLLHTENYLYDY